MRLSVHGGVASLKRDLTSIFMNIKEFVKPIQNNRMSRQDAAPTVDEGMWEWLPATIFPSIDK
jgi:hypothetical protein